MVSYKRQWAQAFIYSERNSQDYTFSVVNICEVCSSIHWRSLKGFKCNLYKISKCISDEEHSAKQWWKT